MQMIRTGGYRCRVTRMVSNPLSTRSSPAGMEINIIFHYNHSIINRSCRISQYRINLSTVLIIWGTVSCQIMTCGPICISFHERVWGTQSETILQHRERQVMKALIIRAITRLKHCCSACKVQLQSNHF